ILSHSGTGVGVALDAGASSGNKYGFVFDNFVLKGNTNTTVSLLTRGFHHSNFRNMSVAGGSVTAVECDFAVCNVWENLRVSSSEQALSPQPATGVLLTRRGVGENCVGSVFVNPVIEGVSGSGIKLVYGFTNSFIGGTS